MGNNRIVLESGRKFGRLTVVRSAGKSPRSGHSLSLCRCECGTEVVVQNARLLSGHTRSCGCLVKDTMTNLQHGESYSRLHHVWSGMKQRCLCPTDSAYARYGGRGITVCKSWAGSYVTFAKWARKNGYRDDLTLDRIDVNDGYRPGNCRFVPLARQATNRRDNHLITYDGKTMCLSDWARETGISSGTIHDRMVRYGWNAKYALTVPVGAIGRHGKERPYATFSRHPIIEMMFGRCESYPDLAEAMSDYIEKLMT